MQLESPEGRKLLAALRKVVAKLPNVAEVIDGFGHTTFKTGEKSFVIAGMGEAGTAISIKSDLVTQDALIRRGPYYRTPYIGQHGWISIDVPLAHDWSEVEELIADGYGLVASKRGAAKKKPAPKPTSKPKKKPATSASTRKPARKKR
jgi:predicted DNA-binding protein (MmcQ/YjbR family)